MNSVGFRPCTRMHTPQLLRYVKSLSHDCQFKLSATEALLDTGSGKNVFVTRPCLTVDIAASDQENVARCNHDIR